METLLPYHAMRPGIRQFAFLLVLVLLAITVELACSPEPYFLRWNANALSSAAAAVLFLALAWTAVRLTEGPETVADWKPATHTWLALLPLIGGAIAYYWVRPTIPEGTRLLWDVLSPIIGIGLVTHAVWRRHAWPPIAAALLLGISWRWFYLRALPIDPARADMIPLVQAALDRLLSGQSPYAIHELPWKLPLTYLPGTFLPYLAARILPLDPRWVTVTAHLCSLAAIVWVSLRTNGRNGLRSPAVALWAWMFLSIAVLFFDATNTAPLGWAALTWLTAALALQSRWAGLIFGLALATTPLALALLPLSLAWLLRNFPTVRAAGRQLAYAAAVPAVLILPWYLWAPDPFVLGVVRWFNDLAGIAAEKWVHGQWWARFPGFAGLFWTYGAQEWMRPIQWAGVCLIAARHYLLCVVPASTPVYTLFTFLWFMCWNPVLWPYFYHPALGMAAVAIAVRWRPTPEPLRKPLNPETSGASP